MERTPGLEKDGFDFWGKYKRSVKDMLDSIREEAEVGQVLFRNPLKKKRHTKLHSRTTRISVTFVITTTTMFCVRLMFFKL